MPVCPACQHSIDDAASAGGKCPACGSPLRPLPTRTISDVRDLKKPAPGDATVPEIAFPTKGEATPFDATVDLSLGDLADLSGEGVNLTSRTLDLSGDAGGEPDAPKPPTVEIASEMTIEFGGASPSAVTSDADFTLLTSQWASGESTDPNATLKQKETIGGSFVTSSSLIVKSRNVRTTGDVVATPISSAADAPDYELLNVIGEGGMGVVYAARQSSIARTVALKMLKGDDSKSAAQREKFISEAVVTGELDHPNIVPIYDLGANNEGALFYSMKRVRGTPWNKVLKKKTLDENLDILLRSADAVAFAHANGVVHRDLKPENTMLGDFGEVLVMDWGLARVSAEFPSAASVTQTSAMGGTPAYMAPEMATGPVERIGPASDIYLLGAMLYEIVVGRPPHSGDTVMACLYNAAKNKIAPVTDDRGHGELLAVAMKAMATEPAERHKDVREFQAAVREYQAHSESIRLSTHAQRNLVEAAEKKDYDIYARAIYGLEEALGLWPQNERAAETLAKARIDYAELSLAKGDFDLAASLLSSENAEHDELLTKIAASRRERESRQRRIKFLKAAVAALVLAVVGVVSVAFVAVSRERNEAVAQRDRAVKAEGEAEENYQQAEVARGEAVEQRDRAVVAEKTAKTNEIAAVEARTEAEKQRDRAEAEEAEAKKQRELAVEARNAEEYAAYVARIGLAKTKIDENAFDRAAELLNQCKTTLRHWEWGRLKQLCQLADRSWAAAAPVDSAAFAPDGAHFATGDWAGDAVIWNLKTGEQERKLPQGQYVHAVAYDSEGKRLAAGSSDGTVQIYDAATGDVLAKLPGHTDAVLGVRFSPDGKELLTCGYDNTARLWDLATNETKQVFRGHSWWVWAAEFSPSGDQIVTASQDGKAIVWTRGSVSADAASAAPSGESAGEPFTRLTEFTHHRGPVYAAKFSPDGAQIATCGYDGRVLVWNPRDAQPIDVARRLDNLPDPPARYLELAGHRGPVRTLSFAKNAAGEAELASGGQDNMVIVWNLAAAKPAKILRGHASHVRSVAWSPDGAQLLSAGKDAQVKLWTPARYAEVESLATDDGVEADDAVLAAHYSHDGKQIITASRNRTASLWDPTTLKRLVWFQEGHEFLATSAVFFAGGSRLATGAGDGTVRTWDVATGAEMSRVDGAGRTAALDVADNGEVLATGSAGADVRIVSAADGKLIATLPGHRSEITALRFAPGGKLLASGDDRGELRLWKLDATNKWVLAGELNGHSRTITALAFGDGGRRLVSASGDDTCGQWDVATQKEIEGSVLKHPDWVADVAVSRDGKLAVTACDDGKLRVWDLDAARELRTLSAPDGIAFTSIDVSTDGRLAAAASAADGTVRVWELATGNEITSQGDDGKQHPWLDLGGRSGLVWAARFAPEGREILAIGGNDARLIDIDTRKLVVRFSPHGAVAAADVSPDGTRVVTGSWDKSAKIWDAATGHVIVKLDGLHEGFVNAASFSPDGERILTASDDGTARLWNGHDGKPLDPVLRGHNGRVRQACFSPDGKQILTVSSDKTARLWNAETGETTAKLEGHEWGLLCGAFSADGRLAITGGEDNTAIVWDVATGQPLQKLAGHTAAVTGVALSPDGARALTGSQDNAVKLWDASTGKEILTLAGHNDEVTSVSFSPDGLEALTSGRDGRVLVWPAVNWSAPAEREARRAAP